MVEFNLTAFKSAYRDYARSYLFYAKIDNNEYFQDINSYLVKSTTLPATTIDEIEANWQGHKYKLGSTPTYDDFTLTFNIDKMAEIRNKMLKWSVYINNPVNNSHGNPSMSSYFSDITLRQVNADNVTIQTFRLVDAWPKTVGEVSLDYTSKETASFDVTFAYQFHTIDGIN